MTDIAKYVTRVVRSDNTKWILQDISEQRGRLNATLDLSKFVKATHYPNGFIPSGVPLGKVTATGKYGPYDNSASDGREVCQGFLFGFTNVRDGQTESAVALWVGPGIIDEAELPFAIDSAGKTDLAAWFKFA